MTTGGEVNETTLTFLALAVRGRKDFLKCCL